jgi:branched-chain amino acid transport system substrate-binding protein
MNNVATGSLITQQFKDQPENYIFAMLPTTVFRPHDCGRGIARRGFKKVAILADSTNYGQLVVRPGTALKAKHHACGSEKFNIKDVDMTAQLLKAKEAALRPS